MTHPVLLGTGGHYSDGAVAYDAGSTYYNCIGLGRCPVVTPGILAESFVYQIMRVPGTGTISQLIWGLDTAFPVALTLTVSKNLSGSSLAIYIPESTTGWVSDTTDSVAVSSGDKLDVSVYLANSPSTEISYVGSFNCVSARFDSTDSNTPSAQMLAAVGSATFQPPSTTVTWPRYASFLGILASTDHVGGDPTETHQQFKSLTAGTWQNMACYVDINQFNGQTAIRNRINASSGSMAKMIPEGTTGYFEDTTGASDSVHLGDLLNYEISTVATETQNDILSMDWIGSQFVPTNAGQSMIGGTPDQSQFNIIDQGVTDYSSLFGGGNPGPSTLPETRATGKFPFALTASTYTNHITDAPGGGAATFTLLKNGSSSGLAATSGSGQTGYFTDNTAPGVNFAFGQTCANQIHATGGSGASITWDGAGLLLTT